VGRRAPVKQTLAISVADILGHGAVAPKFVGPPPCTSARKIFIVFQTFEMDALNDIPNHFD
jgi:hypothetical protein